MYTEQVMEHFANPRNVGEIENADGIGEVCNAKCGDIMKMYIKVDNDVITDVKFKTYGCGSAIATSSIATEMIKGPPLWRAPAKRAGEDPPEEQPRPEVHRRYHPQKRCPPRPSAIPIWG